ncbi:S9 family peptidase, partial [Steroidobacter sp.]|uniref:S9 family peptidase n=1 Tax=Steroidobacter sp. TaxID=1978227 RepID=UPI001A595F13|nr:PD40 domain-containing protein [Steroidobacter sp.]
MSMTDIRSSAGLRLLLGVVLCVLHTSATHAEATYERYLKNLPAVGQLRASSNGAAVTWTRMLEGRRSLWIADGVGLQPRVLLEYPDDDGLPLSSLTIAPDARHVAYIRGGWPNRQGETNNPHDSADPQERVLWMMASDGGAPMRIAGGPGAALHAPTFSTDGRMLAYASGSEVWFAQVANGSTSRAFTIRGRVGALAWSPDRRSLAFVSQRDDHSFVAVFDLATRSIRYLAPSIDRDANPVWSPDGRWLAFVRTREPVQMYRFSDRSSGIPWSILAADTATWTVRTVWTADPGVGSVFVELEQDTASGMGPEDNFSSLLFTADDELIFPWERSGSVQLYRVPVAGGKATAVSRGDGEVSTAAVSANGKLLVYQQNGSSRERFDIYRVDSQRPARLIWEGAPPDAPTAPLADGRVVFIGETSRTPRQVTLQQDATAKAQAIDTIPEQFPTAAISEPEIVTLVAEDGFASRGLLFRPKQKRAVKRPALVWAHGGPRDITLPGVSKYDSRWIHSAVLAGYVVLASNYRGSIGYGRDYRE